MILNFSLILMLFFGDTNLFLTGVISSTDVALNNSNDNHWNAVHKILCLKHWLLFLYFVKHRTRLKEYFKYRKYILN
jgi:hypothetical protein